MEKVRTPLQSLDEHNNLAYALIRSIVGFALFIRGIIFLTNPDLIVAMARNESLHLWFSYITFAHLIGGLMLVIGFLSRLGSVIQLPVLLGAVFMVNTDFSFGSVNQSMELAVLVLVLLMIFSLFGSGSYSLDKIIAKRKFTRNEESGTFKTPKNI